MSESDFEYDQSTVENNKPNRKPADSNKKRKQRSPSNSTPASKKSNVVDIFGIRQNRGPSSMSNEVGDANHTLASYFVNRVGNGCERRTATTDGDYYIDLKVYKSEDARSVDSLELWKKALVRIKFQTNIESPQWRTLQKFVLTADSVFPETPRFFDK